MFSSFCFSGVVCWCSISTNARGLSRCSETKGRTAVTQASIFFALKIDNYKLLQYSLGKIYSNVLTVAPFLRHLAFAKDTSINAQTTIKVQANNLAIIIIFLIELLKRKQQAHFDTIRNCIICYQ